MCIYYLYIYKRASLACGHFVSAGGALQAPGVRLINIIREITS